jgi:hypothetical protein
MPPSFKQPQPLNVEEKAADVKLTELAETHCNPSAATEASSDDQMRKAA